MEKLEKKVNDIQNDVSRILHYLESDDKTNSKGLVERVNTNEEELKQLLNREKVYKAKAGFLGAIGGAIIWLIKIILTKIL